MDKLKILYIDDNPDPSLSKFLDNYTNNVCEFEYSDIIFNPMKGYDSLISDSAVRSANIIFIDSRLFEQRNAVKGKFTGEEFKIILKKYFPFIEVIVVTQNEIDVDYETISKYNPKSNRAPDEYYREKLPKLLDQATRNVFEFRKIASEMEKNTRWEKVMIEKITNSIKGQGTFDELTKKDIDEVIELFQELQEKMDV